MQIQKGLVKYKDRTDIVCTYGIANDGKQYYFLDENSISNGNIIASTALVEAIDPVVVASAIGVIDKEGNVVIPFENKMIKAIAPNLLLVERANSTTPSVVEAIKLRSDPLAATKLVTTPATIKDQINSKMGSEGRFVFNDQFSEATIYNIDGKNLLNGEYYSFIGFKGANTLYLSKNTVESPVVEFVLDVSVPSSKELSEPLDVAKTEVTADTIDDAMNSVSNNDITAADFEDVSLNSEDSQVMVENPVETETTEVKDAVSDVKNNGFSAADVAADMTATSIPNVEAPVKEEVSVETPEVTEEAKPEEVAEEKKEEITAEVQEEPKVEIKEEVKEEVVSEEKKEEDEKEFDSYAPTEEAIDLPISTPAVEEKKEEVKDDVLASFDFGDNINYSSDVKPVDLDTKDEDDDSLFKEMVEKESAKSLEIEKEVNDFKKDLFDLELDSDIFAGSVVHADKIIEDNEPKVNVKDTMFEDVAATLANLIKLSKTQKEKIAVYETKFEQIAETHRKVVEKARSQIRDIEVLKAKVKNYETIVNRLESKIQLLENKVSDQDKLINSQSNELESLRPQVAGKNELARILADAQSLLEDV